MKFSDKCHIPPAFNMSDLDDIIPDSSIDGKFFNTRKGRFKLQAFIVSEPEIGVEALDHFETYNNTCSVPKQPTAVHTSSKKDNFANEKEVLLAGSLKSDPSTSSLCRLACDTPNPLDAIDIDSRTANSDDFTIPGTSRDIVSASDASGKHIIITLYH